MKKIVLVFLGLTVLSCQRVERAAKEVAEVSEDYYSALGSIVFSNQGDMAYVAKKAGDQVVVWNGQEGPVFDRILYISFVPSVSPVQGESRQNQLASVSQVSRLIYIGQKGQEKFLVVNGVVGPAYQDIEFKGVLCDGRLYYTVKKQGKMALIIGDKTGQFYDNLWNITVSPDRKHIAYWASWGDSSLVVVDTIRSPAYDKITDLRKLSRY